MASGSGPVARTFTFRSVATSTAVTVPSSRLVTKTVAPSGAKAISWWPRPVATEPARSRVPVSSTVTPPRPASAESFATQR